MDSPLKNTGGVVLEERTRGYRDRIYEHYVSAFKGAPGGPQLESAFERHGRFYDHLFEPVVGDLKPAKILEVGCGQGRFLFWARRRGFCDVRGFDRSEEQVAIARSLGLAAEVATSADYLARCDKDFDLIVAMDIVEHFGRDEALEFLEQCWTCLRPGGRLFLTTPNGSALRPGPVVYGDLTHETVFSPQTIQLALQLSGFRHIEVLEIAPLPTSWRARIRRGLWALLRCGPALVDLIERGAQTSRVYSRVMGVHARRPVGVPGQDAAGCERVENT